jgi:hypothetical protein
MYVGDRLVDRLERWPATALAWIGTTNLQRRGTSEKQLAWLKAQLADLDAWGAFDRWRHHFLRARGGLPEPGESVERLALLWIRHPAGATEWILYDHAARMAARVRAEGLISSSAREVLEEIDKALTEQPPPVSTRVKVEMPAEQLASHETEWEPDFAVLPDEELFLPARKS